VLAEPGQRVVEVVHREHDAEVAGGVYRRVPVIGDRRRREMAQSSVLPSPSGIRMMAISTRWSRSPGDAP
jgi:hypothetical protein